MNAPTRRSIATPLFMIASGLSICIVVACSGPAPSAAESDNLTAGDKTSPSNTTNGGGAPNASASASAPAASAASTTTDAGTPTTTPGDAGTTTGGQCQPDPIPPAGTDPGADSACIACCDAANPAAATILKQWSTCVEACGDNGSDACFNACDATEETACKGANGACDKLDACENICDPGGDDDDDSAPGK